MSKRIILFNILFYSLTIGLYWLGKALPGRSLLFAGIIIITWIGSSFLLLYWISNKTLPRKTHADRIGIILATPLIFIIGIILYLLFASHPASENYFDKNNYRYRIITHVYEWSGKPKRIEYYKTTEVVDPGQPFKVYTTWVKDSVWVWFSRKGDTVSSRIYKNDSLINP